MGRFYLPIRMQIIALVSAALITSLILYLSIASALIVRDKTSYIYDYTFSQVRWAALTIRSEMETVGNLVNALPARRDRHFSDEFRKLQSRTDIHSYAAIEIPKKGEGVRLLQAGGSLGDPGKVHDLLARLDWKLSDFTAQAWRLAFDAPQGRLILGLRKENWVFLSEVELQGRIFDSLKKNFQIQVVDPSGYTAPPLADSPPSRAPRAFFLPHELSESLMRSEFVSGVREARIGGTDFLMGYERLPDRQHLVLCLIPKSVAFFAARALVRASLVLGGCILLLAIGLTLLLMQRLIHRVDGLVVATERVATGDFSREVPTRSVIRDEISLLSQAFNSMTRKIQELIRHSADKARMEKELETASAVQLRFFPKESFVHGNLEVSGRTISASTCGGDWWQYEVVGDELILIMGDVTGHGVSAALVTASIHSAFRIFISDLRQALAGGKPVEDPFLEIQRPLIGRIQEILGSAMSEQADFPCLLACIHLDTGRMSLVNASHPSPVLFQPSLAKSSPLTEKSCLQLGLIEDLSQINPISIQLSPGDWILWHTDGVFERRALDHKRLNRRDFWQRLDALLKESPVSSSFFCDSVLDAVISFLGTGINDRADDVTVVAIKVSADAFRIKKAA